jgi:hypothetical protein
MLLLNNAIERDILKKADKQGEEKSSTCSRVLDLKRLL